MGVADNTVDGLLTEFEAKRLLATYGVITCREQLVADADSAVAAADDIGYPVALKAVVEGLAHKTERGLVKLALADEPAVRKAVSELQAEAGPSVGLLLCEMVKGSRELIVGLVNDPCFGPNVLLGLGGILVEAVGEAVCEPVPLRPGAAARMVKRLGVKPAFWGDLRGEAGLQMDKLEATLAGLSRLALDRPDIKSVDINPLIVCGGRPVAVDAVIEISGPAATGTVGSGDNAVACVPELDPLFNPQGVIVAGVSTHPGKFGFVALHNLLRYGYSGRVFAVGRSGGEVLGHRILASVEEVPQGQADLVVVCTPRQVNPDLLRSCAARGVKAAFVASAGYGEEGREGEELERELVELAHELGMVLAGPNGQGIVSTGVDMCAQIVAPYPPSGGISVASQSGNLCSAFLNYAVQTGVGVNKAVSCGNSAQLELADYLAYYAEDDDTKVGLAYLEGVRDGRKFTEVISRFSRSKPLVVLKGGRDAAGQAAARSHTGALASDERVFEGVCASRGVQRAATVEEAFEWAATFATQPLPGGNRVAVVTTVGGCGVLAADECSRQGLELAELPDELKSELDKLLPSRWSRGNPVDLAGGETRDTVPVVLDLLCSSDSIDSVLFFGIGVQSAQAQAMKTGPWYPEHGLERIVGFHENQDKRYAAAAAEASLKHGKPVLVATELVYTDGHYGNAGPRSVAAGHRVCYPGPSRAVAALVALVAYSEYLAKL